MMCVRRPAPAVGAPLAPSLASERGSETISMLTLSFILPPFIAAPRRPRRRAPPRPAAAPGSPARSSPPPRPSDLLPELLPPSRRGRFRRAACGPSATRFSEGTDIFFFRETPRFSEAGRSKVGALDLAAQRRRGGRKSPQRGTARGAARADLGPWDLGGRSRSQVAAAPPGWRGTGLGEGEAGGEVEERFHARGEK